LYNGADLSDEESDLDVDFGNIETNIENHNLYSLRLKTTFAVYNEPTQKKIDKIYKKKAD